MQGSFVACRTKQNQVLVHFEETYTGHDRGSRRNPRKSQISAGPQTST
jgi:hypothetical protein